jgi:UDP-glucose 4-epimerase
LRLARAHRRVSISQSRVLVTGGAGFVGSHVVEALLERGAAPVVADDLSTGEASNVPDGVELKEVDIADADALERAFHGTRFDALVHAAAEASVVRSVADPRRSERINVEGTANVIRLAAARGALRIVFFSTGGAIYGETKECAAEDAPLRPASPYGEHKMRAEDLVRESGLPHAILRPANIYGPRQRGDLEGGVVAIFLQRYRERRELIVYGDGTAERDYVYAPEVAQAVVAALEWPHDGTWNIGTGTVTTVNGVIEALRQHLGDPPAGVRYAPGREGELHRACLNPGKAARDDLWRARLSFVEGIGALLKSQRAGSAGRRSA